ncbi:hypothetical protein [Pseudovibrio sp. Ad26]|uniref:hypothetical protein n=1 Tax=Pseudovibrio sp. Ad26 TaxID=989410 RepID=UPI0007AE3B99|nr:hypothetical protein [Pseudovibrio sp. Ad26]KZK99166.1 hypothetical protein PsAD26_04975 [Pseudovibrio sp. Ad26]
MSIGVAIPKPAGFRVWVIRVTELLELSPYQWSVGSGIGQNALSKFINGKQRDLRLETASLLVEHAQGIAQERGITLPALPAGIAGQSFCSSPIKVA